MQTNKRQSTLFCCLNHLAMTCSIMLSFGYNLKFKALMNTWNNGWPNLEPHGTGGSMKVTQNISVNLRMMLSLKLHLSYGWSFNFEIVYFKHGAYRPRPYILIEQCNIYYLIIRVGIVFVKPGSLGFLSILEGAYCRLIVWKNIRL